MIRAKNEVVHEKEEFSNFRTAEAPKEAISLETSEALSRTLFVKTLAARISNGKCTSKKTLCTRLRYRSFGSHDGALPRSMKVQDVKMLKMQTAVFEIEL